MIRLQYQIYVFSYFKSNGKTGFFSVRLDLIKRVFWIFERFNKTHLESNRSLEDGLFSKMVVLFLDIFMTLKIGRLKSIKIPRNRNGKK